MNTFNKSYIRKMQDELFPYIKQYLSQRYTKGEY